MKKIPGNKNIVYVSSLIVLLITLCGCFTKEKAQVPDETVYAKVNDSYLTETEFKAIVPMGLFDRLTTEHKKEIAKEWVNKELLYQEALRLGIDNEEEIKRILKNQKRDFLSNEVLERTLENIHIPSEYELKQYYEKHKDYFIINKTEYRVRYALFDNTKDAQSFYRKVKAGTGFSDLAKKESKDPNAKVGGELGIINEESVEPSIWRAIVNTVETLGQRRISNVFRVIDGWAIVICDEILNEGSIKPFEDVRDQVFDLNMIEKREEMKKSKLLELSSEAEPSIIFR